MADIIDFPIQDSYYDLDNGLPSLGEKEQEKNELEEMHTKYLVRTGEYFKLQIDLNEMSLWDRIFNWHY